MNFENINVKCQTYQCLLVGFVLTYDTDQTFDLEK